MVLVVRYSGSGLRIQRQVDLGSNPVLAAM